MSMYHKLICVRFNDIHLYFLFVHFYDLLLIVLCFLYVFIRFYTRTSIIEHLRYL